MTLAITSQTPGTQRANGGGYFTGFLFKVGVRDLIVSNLGRWKFTGDAATHTLRIGRDNGDGTYTTVIESTVDMTQGSVGAYTTVAGSGILLAGYTYLVLSLEQSGVDHFGDIDTVVGSSADISVLSGCYSDSSGHSFTPIGGTTASYGPLNFTYTTSVPVGVTGPIPAGSVQFVGTLSTSGDFSGQPKTNATDGDPATNWTASNADGGWIGLDLGAAAVVTAWGFMPQIPDSAAHTYDRRAVNGMFRTSTSSDFSTGVTSVDFVPDFPFLESREINIRQVATLTTARYARFFGIPGTYGGALAEFRVYGEPTGGASYRPCPPIISPWGAAGIGGTSPSITITALNGESIYYTTDGSAPTNASTHYTGPFTVDTSGGTVTVKAVAYNASYPTTTSEVCKPAYFRNYGYKPNDAQYDVATGILAEIHNPSIVEFPVGSRIFYMASGSGRGLGVPPNDYLGKWGIRILKGALSADTKTINWIDYGYVIPPEDGFANLERPSLLVNGAGVLTLWIHAANHDTTDRALIYSCAAATDPTVSGNWTRVGLIDPVGIGYKDSSRFEFGGHGYVVFCNGAQTAIFVAKLASDYLSCTGSTLDTDYIQITPGSSTAESPIMVPFSNGSKLAFLYSGSGNYYNSPTASYDMHVRVTTDPMNISAYSAATSFFAVDPIGTDYNGQFANAFIVPGKVDGSIVILADYWIAADEYQSRPVWYPLELSGATPAPSTPASWDLSVFVDAAGDSSGGLGLGLASLLILDLI